MERGKGKAESRRQKAEEAKGKEGRERVESGEG